MSNPEWMKGWNDGVAFAVDELLRMYEEHAAELLMPHVHVDELSREQVRTLRRLARLKHADKIIDALHTAKADPQRSQR